MTCELVKQQLPLLLYGELSFDEEEAVQQHLERCHGCRAALTEAETIHHSLDARELHPAADLLMDCRRNLRAQVAAVENAHRTRTGFPAFFSAGWHWFVKPLGALALVAIGFFGARFGSPENVQRGRAYDQVASRVRFVEPEASGQVRIVLEEVRQRTLSGGMEEEPIRRLLLAAARDASDPGVRVGSMDLLKSSPGSSEVRRALLHALRSDTNAGVRLKALEGLSGSPIDAELGRVLSHVLLTDSNPGVRTQAIDLLIRRKEPAIVGVLQEVIAKEDNNYVRMRCQNALRDMNASVESF